jgi:site-specific DNA-methyltransferase (adenine-specific)
LITPDTIGIFLAYLIKKFHPSLAFQTIFDPLVGSGNLLFTIANQLDIPLELFGLDHDLTQCHLARNLGDLLEYDTNIFYQDTLTFYHTGFDVVVTDLPITDETPYPPYLMLNHHIESVREGGYMFALIENNFFEQDGSDTFREQIATKAQIVGLIQLPGDLFTTHPKSIFILRRHTKPARPLDGFLLVELPSFRDEEGMTSTLYQIDQWIAKRKDDLE